MWLTCSKTLLLFGEGSGTLLLGDTSHLFYIYCDHLPWDISSVCPSFMIGNFPIIKQQIRQLDRLANFFLNSNNAIKNYHIPTDKIRHRDAIAALDLRLSGHSYRQIACFIYGEKLVEEDWNNPNQTLKNRTIRSVKRGFRMMNGDYKKLLK